MVVASLRISVKAGNEVLEDNAKVIIQIDLPNEIFHKILLFIDVHSILNFGRSCRQFKVLADSYYLWRCLFKRDFSEKYALIAQNNELKKLYKVIFVIEEIKPIFIKLQITDQLIRQFYGEDRETIRYVLAAGNL